MYGSYNNRSSRYYVAFFWFLMGWLFHALVPLEISIAVRDETALVTEHPLI